jgi:hypothetical protein
MSISSEISRIKSNVTSAYSALSVKGATMPSVLNTANLKSTIESIEMMTAEAMSIETIWEICGYVPNGGLPTGYTLLDYVESNGSTPIGDKYVDTGVVPLTSDFSVAMKVQSTGGTSAENWFMTVNHAIPNGAGNYLQFGTWSSKFATHLSGVLVDGNTTATNNVINVTLSVSGATVSLTGDATYSGTNAYFQSGIYRNYPITVLCGNWRCYGCQVYLAGDIVRDYVPCINPSGEVGLYDKVGKAFYGNAGTGAFTAGYMLPEDYTRLEYIQSSGTQFIDTGIAFSSANYNKAKLSVDMDAANASGAYEVNGTGTSGSNCFYIGNYNGTVVYGHGTNDASTGKTHQTGRCKYTIDAKNRTVSADGMSDVSFTPQSPTGSVNLRLCGFGRTNGTATGFSGKFYAAQIWIDDVLVRDFVPCYRNNDGEVGLYDMINAQFYSNAGSGSFTGA